jgi:soluble lytic murein transglycosylase-like protein
MQVLLKTAKWMLGDDTLTISKLVTPKVNIEAGTKYIKYQLNKYGGNVKDAIAAYNAGKVRKLQDGSYKNQKYVDKVHRLYLQYRTGKPVSAGFGGNTLLIAAASLAAGAAVFALAS